MLRGKVAFRGRFVRTDEFDRGEPILHTAEEWSRRGKETSDRYVLRYTWVITLSFLPIWWILAIIIGASGIFWVIYPPIYCLSMVAMKVFFARYFRNREVEQRAYSGLFQKGIQFRIPTGDLYFFVPYELIEDFEVREGWLITKLILKVRGFSKPLKWFHAPQTLGEDGLMLLRRMLTWVPEPEGPPRLVLYSEGGKSVVDRDAATPKFDVRSQL